MIGMGFSDRYLNEAEVEGVIESTLAQLPLDGKRVLVLVPDHTRTFPLPFFFRQITRCLQGRVRALDVMVALGTHPPLNEPALLKLFGLTAAERAGVYSGVGLFNHDWANPAALTALGEIPADRVSELSGELLQQSIPVTINRLALQADHLLICGPVFPHEVAGFSGGSKYFFPGIAGPEVIHLTHWLGALVTSSEIIGRLDTPVRRLIDEAASLIPVPRSALCAVVTPDGVAGLWGGSPEETFGQAAALSARWHIRWLAKPVERVLAVLPEMYDELWVGAKGVYKTEPVVADGGEIILYAPHLREISLAHGALIRQVGYHVRDFFLAQWDRYAHIPLGVLAHSTHVRGPGSYTAGHEVPRIQVTLATGIPADVCRSVNLGYQDPTGIEPERWARPNGKDLLVPHAGEVLYRLERGAVG